MAEKTSKIPDPALEARLHEAVPAELRAELQAQLSAIVDEDLAFENALRSRAVPAKISAEFAEKLQKLVPANAENSAEFRVPAGENRVPAKSNSTPFSLILKRVFAGTVAVAALVVAGIFSVLGNGKSPVGVPAEIGVPANEISQAIAQNDVPAPDYQLVANENLLCDVDDSSEVILQADGTVVRPTRYVYLNTKRWKDANSSKQIESHEKVEQVVPVVFAIY